jgi:hypothetical protein
LPRVDITSAEEERLCVTCGLPIPKGRFCAQYGEEFFCGPECVDTYMENRVGRDFIAAQDQALASAIDVLNERPRNFVLLYSLDGDSIITSMLAVPDFVAGCIPVLIQASTFPGDVKPPS